MEKELRQELNRNEVNRLKYLGLMHAGRGIKTFGLRGTLLANTDSDFFWILTGVNLLIHGTIYLICWAIFQGNWLLGLALYAAIHLGIYFGGRAIENNFDEKLMEMSHYFNGKCSCYYDTECEKRNIYGDAVLVEDVRIRSGSAECYIKNTKADIQLYCLESVDGDVGRFDRKLNPLPDEVDMKKYITSVAFNKKFSILTKKGKEMDCIDMFRPTVQVAMSRNQKIEKLGLVEIGGGYFRAGTNCSVEPTTTYIDVYGDKSLRSYFEDIDRFCKEMAEMGEKVFHEVNFITTGMNLNK